MCDLSLVPVKSLTAAFCTVTSMLQRPNPVPIQSVCHFKQVERARGSGVVLIEGSKIKVLLTQYESTFHD